MSDERRNNKNNNCFFFFGGGGRTFASHSCRIDPKPKIQFSWIGLVKYETCSYVIFFRLTQQIIIIIFDFKQMCTVQIP